MTDVPSKAAGYVADVRRWAVEQAIRLADRVDGGAERVLPIADQFASFVLGGDNAIRRWAAEQAVELIDRADGDFDVLTLVADFVTYVKTGQYEGEPVPPPVPPPEPVPAPRVRPPTSPYYFGDDATQPADHAERA